MRGEEVEKFWSFEFFSPPSPQVAHFSFLSLFSLFSLSPLHLKFQPPPPPPNPKKQQDLYAVNAYTTRLVSRKDGTPSGDGLGTTNYLASENTTAGVPLGPVAESSWLLVDPAGFGKLLVYLNKR